MRRVSLRISGKVQGVFFRQSTLEVAQQLGLRGWVKNLPTGEVQALAEGPEEQVEALIQFCHQGPPLALVTHVEVTESLTSDPLPPFHVVHR
jgi:acylphosphatase